MNQTLKTLAILLVLSGAAAPQADAGLFKRKKAPEKKELSQAQKDSTELAKTIGDVKETRNGMFDFVLNKEGKLFMLLPDSAFNDTYLLVSRISGLSNTSDFVAGQMNITPLAVKFSKDDNKVFMHLVNTDDLVEDSDPIRVSFERNMLDPVVRGFKIKGKSNGKTVVDVTDFFLGDEKIISPIKDLDPLSRALSGRDAIEGRFYSDGSSITAVKSFPDNVMVQSRLAYTTKKATQPYTVDVSRSFLRLPDKPMKMRLQDNRVGYFYDTKRQYTSKTDKLEMYNIINRFRLEPKEEDMEAYMAGELVEPKKPIIFYVDSAFPEKWAKAVKEGIEYWNMAFEEAGFKNAVKAMDYPADNAEFDPDDIRFNCVRYCVTPTANAMGPSYIDPRSGEILGADVIWYHNVISLVHDWRFAQTGAVDPRVRKKVFDDDVMHESLTYVTAHEIGHCLGLMHNMGASYAYTLENLRDPEFTQKYGTTPSIMDYARNNFVAQPGDLERGVRLTPPPVGVYDIYAINWGYRLIPDAETPFDERPVLNSWIAEKDGDPMYEFGAQQFLGLVDPTDQTEDLGNDHIKAGDMSISNLKIVMENLEDWAGEKDRNYDPLLSTYKAVISQYLRHVGHVMPYVGGVVYKEIRQGDGEQHRSFISKKDTKRAVNWLLDQARTCDWLMPDNFVEKFEDQPRWKENVQKGVIGCMFSPVNINRIKRGYQIDPANNYDHREFLDDVIKGIFAATYAGKKIDDNERALQAIAIETIANASGLPGAAAASPSKSAAQAYEEITAMLAEPSIPCSLDHGRCAHDHGDESRSFFRLAMGDPALPASEFQPMMTAQLKKLLSLYRSAKAPDTSTREFYDFQIRKIDRILNADK